MLMTVVIRVQTQLSHQMLIFLKNINSRDDLRKTSKVYVVEKIANSLYNLMVKVESYILK